METITELKEKYPFIRAWCEMMGSFPYYVAQEVCRAEKDDAPRTATFYHTSGDSRMRPGWHTLEDITNPDVLDYMREWCDRNDVEYPL